MARHTRKGRNPGPVDAWLDVLGFYRKNVAYDETCLFRAVSEQLFSCQIYHERCRKEVVEYARANYDEFSHLMSEDAFSDHLTQLEVHMAVCGNTEMQIISKKYRKDILVFNGNVKQMFNVTPATYDDTLMVCLMGEDHYDAVYKKEYIEVAGYCQSIVYSVLYENVFNIPNVTKIVDTMLYDRSSLLVVNTRCNEERPSENETPQVGLDGEKKRCSDDYEYMLQTHITPFPFKVAKALDENIYRNIEYDTWTEIRKELRLGQWYYGDKNLILGTGCLLTTDDGILQCYIQEIRREQDVCVVYITSLAERRTVKYSNLAPETDAKPWPLPYRFERHTNSIDSEGVKHIDANNNNNIDNDKTKRSLRRRRDNKRNQSRPGNDNGPTLTLPIRMDVTSNNPVQNFEGSPLHMQQHIEHFEQHATPALENHDNGNYYAMEPNWIKTFGGPEQVVMSRSAPTSLNMYAHAPKPMTPEIIYTADANYTPQCVQAWSRGPEQPQMPQEFVPQNLQEVLISPNPYPYYCEQIYQPPVIPVPTSPQVPFYPNVFPGPTPVTPVIMAPAIETQEVIMMTPPTAEVYAGGVYPPSYNPPMDMSFMSPPFVYPSSPNWYHPPPIDAQGFVFPTCITPHK